jgi:toxin YoeB
MYGIIFSDEAKKNLKNLASNKQSLTKLEKLLDEIRENPRFGTGQIEQLKYYTKETWSRRIDKKNRIIYSIDDKNITVTLISITGHYNNK